MKHFLVLVLMVLTCGCVNWRENADKTLIWAHQAAKHQSQIAEPYFRFKCGKVTKNCQVEMAKAGKSCKTDAECAKQCPALVACQDERHTVNKAIIGVNIAVLSGRQLLVASNEDAVIGAIASIVSVVSEMRKLSFKYGIFGDDKIPVVKPTTQPASKVR